MDKPEIMKQQEEELKALCEKYPQTMPIEVVGKFLGIDPNCIRRWAYQYPNNPFAIGMQGQAGKNDYSRVVTMAFVNWLTKH